MKKYFYGILSIALLTSCIPHQGTEVTQSDLSQFHKGSTTYQEVVDKLGEPQSSITNADGSKTIMYQWGKASMDPLLMVPIVGAFMSSGIHSQSGHVDMTFNSNDILRNYTVTNNSNSEGGTNSFR